MSSPYDTPEEHPREGAFWKRKCYNETARYLPLLLMRKLYLPYGTLRTSADPRQITYHWFIIKRETPLAPYDKLILSYNGLSDDARVRAEQTVDEMFSQEEFEALRDYLRDQRSEDLRTGILNAPISANKPDTSTRLGTERPFQTCSEGVTGGFMHLSEQPGYNLPFTVWGYYAMPAHLMPSRNALAEVSDDSDDE